MIIDYIDQKKLISHRYFRDSCWKSDEGFYVKDLRVINRDLKNVLLIDNVKMFLCRQLTAIVFIWIMEFLLFLFMITKRILS